MSTNVAEGVKRHSLNTEWTQWYDYQDKKYVLSENWCDNLQVVSTTSNAESFWAIQNEVGDTEKLPISSNMHFFRTGIQPMWEDKKNAEGGKWILEVTGDQKIHDKWINTLLFCISERVALKTVQKTEDNKLKVNEDTVDTAMCDAICGAVLSPRRNYTRISLWTKIKDIRVMHIGKLWKEFAEIPDHVKITFKAHEGAMKGMTQEMYSI